MSEPTLIVPKPPVQPSVEILDYYYDDPSELALHGRLIIPSFPKNTPEFTVVGWKNIPDVEPGTPAYQAAQVWGAIATTLAYVMNLDSTPPYLADWSSTYNLVAIPRAGNELNAYYDRSSLRFFWGRDPKTKATIFTCDAVGIVSHELGHAVLDAMRPDLWNTAVLEFFAFHEAFGDILAISSTLQHDTVIEQMLAETKVVGGIPDLWQSNVVSRLARQLGHAIYFTSNMTIGAEKYLRNAFNDFKYVDPLTLPLGSADLTLTQEPHNFSRVFSGAWYECFCELFKFLYTRHTPPVALIAVKEARDIMIHAVLDAVKVVPSDLHFFFAMSTTIINVLTKQGKTEEAKIAKRVFQRRKLWNDGVLTPVTAASTIKIGSVTVDHLMQANIGATISHPSMMVNVEVPKFVALENGKDPVTSLPIHETLQKSVMGFINYATEEKLLGDEFDNNMFAVTSTGLLRRNYICSSFKAQPQIAVNSEVGHIAK